MSEKQRPIPIDSVIDVSATEQKLERLQQDYLELLNSVKKTTNEGSRMKNELERYGIQDSDRTPCEIWTRVMGYHRPISSFNIGKQGR